MTIAEPCGGSLVTASRAMTRRRRNMAQTGLCPVPLPTASGSLGRVGPEAVPGQERGREALATTPRRSLHCICTSAGRLRELLPDAPTEGLRLGLREPAQAGAILEAFAEEELVGRRTPRREKRELDWPRRPEGPSSSPFPKELSTQFEPPWLAGWGSTKEANGRTPVNVMKATHSDGMATSADVSGKVSENIRRRVAMSEPSSLCSRPTSPWNNPARKS